MTRSPINNTSTNTRELAATYHEIAMMHTYKRPYGSEVEKKFIQKYLAPLGFKPDQDNNQILTIGNRPFLFSSHSDTVHHDQGSQSVAIDGSSFLSLSKQALKDGSNCLGADDTAGIWLMLEMVKANIAGTYIIHYGEEVGCIGSSALASHNPAFLRQFQAAIAFDRAGYGDVITHQMGRRTCSNAFATTLSEQLGGDYQPCDKGMYTDTYEYAHLIPECTNLSVGYFNQHTPNESLDMGFLVALRNSLVHSVDWDSLPIERQPDASPEPPSQGSKQYYQDMVSVVLDYPEIAADLLEGMGYTAESLLEEIEHFYYPSDTEAA